MTEGEAATARRADQGALLQLILDSMRHGIALFDAEGRLVAANELARRLGIFPGETLPTGMTIMAIVDAQAAAGEFGDAETTARRVAAARAFDRSIPSRYSRTRPDGTVLEITSDPTPDGGFIVTYSDVTARTRAEQAARDRAAMLTAALDSMQHGCLIYGPDDRLLAANALAASIAGLPPEELVPGRSRAELVRLQHARGAFGSGAAAAAERDRLIGRPTGRYSEMTRSAADGRVTKVASNPIGPDGAGGHVVTYTDVTPLAQAEAASRARAELLQTMQETMKHGIALFGPDQRLVAANDLAAELAGLRPGEMPPGTTTAEIAALQLSRGLFGEGAEATRAAEVASRHDRRLPRFVRRRLTDGRIVDSRSDPTPDGGFVITWSDVTPLIEAEKAAAERAAMLQAMIENMRHGIALFDAEGRVVAANRLVEDLAGVPPGTVVPGRHVGELITVQQAASAPGDAALDAQYAAQALAADRSKPLRHVRPSRDGRMLDVASDPMPDGGFVITITDITALTRAEAELRQRAELQAAMLKAIRHGIALYDADYRLIAVNRIFGGPENRPFPEGRAPMPPGTPMADILRRQAALGGLGPEPEKELERLLALDRRLPHRYMRRTTDGRLLEVHSDPMPAGGFAITFSDVTALAAAEAEAASRAAMLRAALDTMRHGFMLFGPDHRLRASNRLATEIGGLSAEELQPGIPFDEQLRLHHARGMFGSPPRSDETLARLLAADRSQSWRRTRRMPGGEVIEIFSDPTPDGGFVVTFTDITARAEAEAEAKRRANALQITLDSVRHGIALYGPDRRLILANRLAGPHHGVPDLPERAGTLFDDLLREQYALGFFGPEPEAKQRFTMALGRDRSIPAQLQRRMPDGRVIDIASDPTPEGGFVITQSDVTALEHAKAEASDRAAMLQLMLDNIRHGISYFGPDRRLTAFNRLAEELAGEGGSVTLRRGATLEELVAEIAGTGAYGDAGQTAAMIEARLGLDRSRPHRYLRRTGGRLVEVSSSPAPNGGFVVTHSDVTDLLEAQAAVAERSAQLQVMLETMRHGIALFDRDRRLVTANALAATLNGLDQGAFEPGRSWGEVVADISAAGLLDPGEIERIIADDYSLPLRLVRPGGDGRVIEVTTNPTPEGGFVATYTDITALTQAEAAARERAGVLQVMLENTRHGICYYGADRRVIAANGLAAEFGEYSPGTLRPGRSIEELVEDQLRREVAGEVSVETAQLALTMDRSQPARYTRPTRDGRIIEVTSDPTPGGGFVVTTADITPLVRAEQEARSRAAILQAMLDNSRQGIILFDLEGRVVAANGIAAGLTGLPPEAIWPGLDIRALIARQVEIGHIPRDGFADALALVPRDRPWPVPYMRRRTLTDGRIVEVLSDGVAGVGYIRMYRDITEELHARAELERARDAAETANRAKSRFLATMSHELRTPLNAVIGFSEAYLIDKDPARRLDYVQSIHEAGRHLLSLIDDILDVTRSETTGLQITEGQVAVLPLAEGAVQMMQATAATAGVTLGAILPPHLPLLRADELRLRQVLLNLLANAVKFTPAGGGVTLGAEVAPEGDLVLRVSDTGIGIAPGDISRAFEPFTQLDSSLSRRFPGSGLGLYLSRALAEAQGATLSLESTPGQGTTALLRFPKDRLLAELAA